MERGLQRAPYAGEWQGRCPANHDTACLVVPDADLLKVDTGGSVGDQATSRPDLYEFILVRPSAARKDHKSLGANLRYTILCWDFRTPGGETVSAQVWVALIAASASLLVAIFSAQRALRMQKDIAQLSHQLQEQSAERSARRDYEYEARKRLYTECEPVIFEAMEMAENFRRRVISLARSSRQRSLSSDGTGWLDGPRRYYFRTTAFYLLAPVTSFKILQRRLTGIDLALEPRLELQYRLLKLGFLSYTWDHDLSRVAPSLNYRPDDADPGKADRIQLLREHPSVYRRQGLYLGIVDQIADALVTTSKDSSTSKDSYRCMSLGEFWIEFDNPQSKLGQRKRDITELLVGFHPKSCPVLWRVLVTQYQLFGVLLRTGRDTASIGHDWSRVLRDPGSAKVEGLDWGSGDHELDARDARTPLLAGYKYLLNSLKDLADTRE